MAEDALVDPGFPSPSWSGDRSAAVGSCASTGNVTSFDKSLCLFFGLFGAVGDAEAIRIQGLVDDQGASKKLLAHNMQVASILA